MIDGNKLPLLEKCVTCPFVCPKAELVANIFASNDIIGLTNFSESTLLYERINEIFLFSQIHVL